MPKGTAPPVSGLRRTSRVRPYVLLALAAQPSPSSAQGVAR